MEQNLQPSGQPVQQGPAMQQPLSPQPSFPYSEGQYPYYEPHSKYTLRWLGLHIFYLLATAFALAYVVNFIDVFAKERSGVTLVNPSYLLFDQATWYSFALIGLSTLSLLLIDTKYRKNMNYVQYLLVSLALGLFYLLLLSFAEHMSFPVAYSVVTAMTVALIAWFVNAIVAKKSAVGLLCGILVAEYAIIYLLINLGEMALLIGSLLLFAILAVAMYFTLKVKVENQQITIK